ncbi:MAG: amidohydrolase family protein, partial [Pseudomonadota bacterium]|nr:amidohydrolase family protein [Pseudomonadota bacterium]
MTKTTVFTAKNIITMNPSRPLATHVAVRDGRILAAGSKEEMAGWGPFELNDDFADKVLTPGFVEGHAHAMEGGIWDYTYVGFQDRWDPDGRRWPGIASIEAVMARLKDAEAKLPHAETPLFAWGLDPIYFAGGRMSVTHLDQISTTRPILVLHSNGHLLNVNSRILEMAGITAGTNVYGVLKDEAGEPTGELMEMAAKYMAYRQTGNPFFGGIRTPSLLSYAKSAVNCGVTTATDLYATFNAESLAAYAEASLTPGYALRLMPAMNTIEQPLDEGLALMKQARAMNNDRLHHRLCKVMTDGSIQGFTARLKWPG